MQATPRQRSALALHGLVCPGQWGPELVEIAGVELIGHRESDSVAVTWDAVVEAAPEVLVLAGCRLSCAPSGNLPILRSYPGFEGLPAA